MSTQPQYTPHSQDPRDYPPVPPINPWMIIKWVALGIGGMLVIVASAITSYHASGIAALGLFFGIVARIMQAEEHKSK